MPAIKFMPPVIAHRGASGYAPENTLAAFAKAKELGVRWVEFDVQLTKDGELVVFHDDLLDRTTNAKGPLSQQTLKQIKNLDAGSWFRPHFSSETIPSLKEVLVFLEKEHLAANIELKPLVGQEQQLAKKILTELSALDIMPSANLLFSSFSVPALRAMRHAAPKCLIGLLMDEWIREWPVLCHELDCISIHVNYCILNPARAKEIKAMNKYLLCYTVNDSAVATQLFSWGVDALFTDYPDKIYKW